MKRFIWTKELCITEALKYNTRTELRKNNPSVYTAIHRNNWGEELFSHMEYVGSLYYRMIYAYEFSDNHVYVGLTGNVKKRNIQHVVSVKNREFSPVYKHMSISKSNYILKYLTEYIPVNEAIKTEKKMVKKYKKNGWIILNKMQTGGIGGGYLKWDKESALIEARKYRFKSDFHKKSIGAYMACKKNGWFVEATAHMKVLQKPFKYWNYENCKIEALKYKTKTELSKKNKSAYGAMRINGWINKICAFMENNKKPHRYWNYENCIRTAKLCKNLTQFIKEYSGAYSKCKDEKWMNDIYLIYKIKKPINKNFWNKKTCKQEALKYNNRFDFRTKSSGAYQKAQQNKWLCDITKHMLK
jgi:predicted GIY-YIG superfamily endonuclease